MRELMLALATGACCATTALAQRDADYTAPRQASASAAGARRILVAAGAGSLRIEGKRGLTEVRARGTAFASSRGLLDEIRLVASRRGDVVELRTDIPEHRGGDWDNFQAGVFANPVWGPSTNNRGINCHLDIQHDGNLVIYGFRFPFGPGPLWSSDTWRVDDGDFHVSLRDDGHFAIYRGADPTVRGEGIWVSP